LREAGAELDAGIKLAPQAFKLYEGKAQLALMQRDEQGAERALLALKAAAPGLPAASLRLGTFYARQGRLEPALKAFEDAAALAPYDTVPLVSIVALLTRAQKFDQADARLDRSFKQAPDSSVLLRLKGDIALARPDLAAAADAYQRAIQADPRSAASYQGLSNVRLRSGDLAGAISALEAGEKAVPQDLILPMTRAETLVGAHRVDEAIALYETLMKAHPEEDAVANNLAFLLADNRTDPASLERALAVSSRFVHTRNPQYLDSLGWVRYRRGEYAQAVTVLEQAVALSGGKALHQMHLGLALVKSGNAERGKDLLRRAVKDQADLPQLAEARVALGAR
jgi:tetratricopeptide (TPR) repeat protein